MSITFAAEPGPIASYQVGCRCTGTEKVTVAVTDHLAVSEAYQTAVAVLVEFRDGARPWFAGCIDELCQQELPWIIPVEETPRGEEEPSPEVNVSNHNGRELLTALGYLTAGEACDMWSGTDTADGFLGRVLLAEALLPADEGVPAHAAGRVIECGRPAGYMQDRLTELREVAQFAVTYGRSVCWA